MINGATEPYAISIDSPVTISWFATVFDQMSFEIQLLDSNDNLIFTKKQCTTDKKIIIDLSRLDLQRQTIFVQLNLSSIEKEQKKLNGQFVIASEGIQKAKWITRLDNPIAKEAAYFRDNPTIVLTKKFQLENEIKSAWVDICGLGYYTLYINEQRIGKDYLNNDVTNYNKVVYYDTYEISKNLKIGENSIAVELGNGWYNPAPINILGKYNVRKQLSIGQPCLIANVDFEELDGRRWQIQTDNSWESKAGNILMNNVFVGEKVSDQLCKKQKYVTVKIPGPTGILTPSSIPKIQRVAKCIPQKTTHFENKIIVDFGEILSGQISFTIEKSYVGKIILNYAERLFDEKQLDFSSTISGVYGITDPELGITPNQRIIQSDTLEKTQELQMSYSNQYTYHSFRYVEIIFDEPVEFGKVFKDFSAFRVHTNTEVLTEFHTSLPALNDLWCVSLQTRLNNIHSYFEDCTRERFGYGGDIVALIDSHLYSIDGVNLLKKVMQDFLNDQTEEGGISATAPFVGIMTNGPSNQAGAVDWQLVLPTIANRLLQFYDEQSFVQCFTEEMKRHISYLLCFDFQYIKACSLGDWGSIDEKSNGTIITSPDQEFCSACSYSIILQQYLSVMRQMNELEMVDRLSKKIVEVKRALVAAYFRPEGHFGEGTQSSYIFALKANLVEGDQEAYLIKQLVQKIQANDGIISAGIFGMAWIYELLDKHDYQAVLFKWLTRAKSPSYQAMFAETGTLSEHFPVNKGGATYSGSLNHAMFSSYSSWMVKHFLGIRFSKGFFGKVMITPQTEFYIEEISGSVKTPYGKVQIHWTQNNERVMGEIFLPKNLSYELKISADWQSEKHFQELDNQKKITLVLKRIM